MTVAVILAGGAGSRMAASLEEGGAVPKQFMLLAGREVIEYSIDTFCSHPAVDEVCVVVHPDWRGHMESMAARNNWPKLRRILDGGAERYMSSLAAIMAYIDYPDDTVMMLHDAARPFVTPDIIGRLADAMKHSEAAGVAVPCTDTLWEVHPDLEDDYVGRFVARVPERRLMWCAQTPQAFLLPTLRDAYQRALQDPRFAATDDCGVVRRYMGGVKIRVVEGDERNFKLTVGSDLARAAALLNNE